MAGYKKVSGGVLYALALCILPTPGHAAPASSEARDSGGITVGSVEVVARINNPDPSGIAVTPEGRIFLGFPRHVDDHKGPTLAELVHGTLQPYPDRDTSYPSEKPVSDRLISVHGMTTDTLGRLWLIDDGKRVGQPIAPGAAKVVGIDPHTNRIVASIPLRPPVLLADSHMNDLRVDLTHGAEGTAFVTDSSFGTTPAIVVVDIATGRQRRVLANDHSTQAEPGFMAIMEGKPLVYNPHDQRFPSGGVDGITLSTDSRTLYFAPLSSRRLYSIPTAVLADFSKNQAALSAAVRDVGEKGFADGLATDAQGRIYTTDQEHDEILRRDVDGRYTVLARDPRLFSADGIYAAKDAIYVTLGQWGRSPPFNHGIERRRPAYLLIRIPLASAPRFDLKHAQPDGTIDAVDQ